MKTLVFLALFICCSACTIDFSTVTKVQRVQKANDGCYYSVEDQYGHDILFLDDCGLFNVGDTVDIVKTKIN